jgi:hypothetical protein
LPKLALAALVWVLVIAAILVVISLPALAIALLGDTVGLPALVTVLAAGGAFVVTLYFAHDLLDL